MLHSLSLRWKILLALLCLSLLAVTILLTLFSTILSRLEDKKNQQLMELGGRFAIQSLLDYEQLLRTQLRYDIDNPSLAAAIDALLTDDDTRILQRRLQQLSEVHGLTQVGLQLPNGRLYQLTSSSTGTNLQKHLLSKAQSEAGSMSAPESGNLELNSPQPGIKISLPILLNGQAVARLRAQLVLNDQLVKKLRDRVGIDLAFHNGQEIVAASLPELKTRLPDMARQGVSSIKLGTHLLDIHPLTFDSGGNSGLLLLTERTPDQGLTEKFRRELLLIAAGLLPLITIAAFILARKLTPSLQQVQSSLQEQTAAGNLPADSTEGSLRHDNDLCPGNLHSPTNPRQEGTNGSPAAPDHFEIAIEKMRTHAAEVSHNADTQAVALESAHQAINDIGKAAAGIAENVSELVASVQESAAATHQFGSATQSIAQQTENLFAAVSDISASIQQLSSSHETIDQNVTVLHTSTQETVSAIEQLELATGSIEARAQQSSERAQDAAVQALEGKAAMQDTIRGISGLQQLIEQAHKAILDLGSQSDAIGSIVNVIADVADQTNLLALNAAIIAAQAGNQGHGFAVVAEEIRNLAERTTTSADEINGIIANLQSGTHTAVDAIEAGSARAKQEVAHAHAAGKVLEELHRGALESTGQVQTIAELTQRQSEESRKITQAATGISSMLQQISGSMREQTESTRQMANAARSMTDIAARVKLSTEEQSRGGQQIALSIEHIQQSIEQIDSATQELKLRSDQIIDAVSSVRRIAVTHREKAAAMSEVVDSLSVPTASQQDTSSAETES